MVAILGYNHGEGKIISNTTSIITKKSNFELPKPETLKAEDSPGVGKILVGPNGPVDASAAAKVVAAGTMPNIPVSSSAKPSAPVISSAKAKPPTIPIVVEKLKISPKQCVLKCDCCFVTVNSQHQLDLHLNGEYQFNVSTKNASTSYKYGFDGSMINYSIFLGVKHRKVIHKLEKSSDPEDALKLKKALEQAEKAKSIETLTNESKSISISSKSIQCRPSISSVTSKTHPSQESHKVDALIAQDNTTDRNLPPGYVIVTSNQPGEPDTFVCKVCPHSSKDVYSVNAVSISLD